MSMHRETIELESDLRSIAGILLAKSKPELLSKMLYLHWAFSEVLKKDNTRLLREIYKSARPYPSRMGYRGR